MNIDTVISIDIGKTGGVAVFSKGLYTVHKMPSMDDLNTLLKHHRDTSETILVVIEKVMLLPSDINNSDPKAFGRAVRIGKMLDQYSSIKTIMNLLKIPYIEVMAVKWQSYLHLRPTGWREMSSAERKRLYRDFAQDNFPGKVILQVADAVCVLVYALRNIKYNPDFVQELPEVLTKNLFR